VLDFAKRAIPTFNSSDRPHLVLVQNFCEENSDESYDVRSTTVAFHLQVQEHQSWEEVEASFSSIHFVKIPDATKNIQLFGDQITQLMVSSPPLPLHSAHKVSISRNSLHAYRILSSPSD